MTNKMVESAFANIGFFSPSGPEIGRIVRKLERLHLMIIIKSSSWYLTELVYIYIYIYREREREIEREKEREKFCYIYIYIYIYRAKR